MVARAGGRARGGRAPAAGARKLRPEPSARAIFSTSRGRSHLLPRRARCGRCSTPGRTAPASTTASAASASLQEGAHGRYVLVEPSGPIPSSAHQGDRQRASHNPRNSGCRVIRGLRVEDQPDYAYGKWVASLYREVLPERGPEPRRRRRGDQVAAVSRARAIATAADVAVRGESGRPTLVLGATVLDHAIDLRVKPQLASARSRRQAPWRPSRQDSSARRPEVAVGELQVPFPVRIAEAVDHAAVEDRLHDQAHRVVDLPAREGEARGPCAARSWRDGACGSSDGTNAAVDQDPAA